MFRNFLTSPHSNRSFGASPGRTSLCLDPYLLRSSKSMKSCWVTCFLTLGRSNFTKAMSTKHLFSVLLSTNVLTIWRSMLSRCCPVQLLRTTGIASGWLKYESGRVHWNVPEFEYVRPITALAR